MKNPKVDRTKKEVIIPDELKAEFKINTSLKNSFNKLTNSCQREYTNYIIEAKRAQTKLSRIQKIIPMILENKGLHDQYKNC